MPASDNKDDLRLLTEAAQEAGELALRYWKRNPNHWEKEAGAGPVSEADLAVNDLLKTRLLAARPDYGWLSEESHDDASRHQAQRVFVIDPIDGTRAFLANDSGFAHALAVVEGGKAQVGVVHLPARGLSYCAESGGAAVLNGQPIRPSQADTPEGSTLLSSKASDDAHHWRGVPPGYLRSFRPSLAWRLCLVAEGRFDATLSLRPVWDWDIAAASLIAECAGASCSNRHGAPLSFNSAPMQNDGLLVAPPALHARYLAALAP